MSETRTITMKTNFEGLIRLLADGLYSTSDIFVRELIQNGHDSIVRREALKESFYQGEISITYDSSEKSITFADNGIGMDESDIENFLSVIGSTGTGISKGELEDMAELRLYYYEDKLDDAWDTLQRIKAEEQYLGRAGMYVGTLGWEILIGIKTKRMEQVKPALGIFFKKYRNSEDLADRYMCYKAFARYCCASCRIVPPENRERMERHAEFWLKKAEQMAGHLDGLMQVAWRTEQIKKIREGFEKI